MSLVHILYLGIIPAGLLMWGGNVVRNRSKDETTQTRWLYFLVVGLCLSFTAFFMINSITTYLSNLFIVTLFPITVGFSAELILNLRKIREAWSQRMLQALSLSTLAVVTLIWGMMSNSRGFLMLVAVGTVGTVLVWIVWGGMKKRPLIFCAVEILLLGISIWSTDTNRLLQVTPAWLMAAVSFTTFAIIPATGIVLSALLIREPLLDSPPFDWREMLRSIFLTAIILSLMGYQIFLYSVWDVATDGLGGIGLWFLIGIIATSSALLMAWSMPRRWVWVAVLFALTMPAITQGSMNLGAFDSKGTWGTKPILMTERRAERLDKAIQQYYVRNHEYPQKLADLTPRYILYIPNPYIIPGQDWCYEGGKDYYRFGYVYRQYFSSAASVKIHSSAGEPVNPVWNCEKEAEKYPMPGF